jgi:CheY-like chemotaxis protein
MLSTIRLLIAEDSPTTAVAMRTALGADPQIEFVATADTAQKALDMVEGYEPDVVMVDVGMPGMDGIDLCRAIRSVRGNVRILMVTADNSEATVFRAFSAGADGYFVKCASLDNLASAVRSVAQGAAWLDPKISSMVLKKCAGAGMNGGNGSTAPPVSSHLPGHLLHTDDRDTRFFTAVGAQSPIWILLLLGSSLESKKDDLRAEATYHGALALAEKMLGPNDLDVAAIATRLGDFYYDREKFARAEPLYQKALQVKQQSLGETHSEVATSLENLASLHEKQNDHEQAERYYLLSLSIRENLNSPKLTAETCSKLAWICRALGKSDIAERMDKQAAELRLTPTSPGTKAFS